MVWTLVTYTPTGKKGSPSTIIRPLRTHDVDDITELIKKSTTCIIAIFFFFSLFLFLITLYAKEYWRGLPQSPMSRYAVRIPVNRVNSRERVTGKKGIGREKK